MEHVEFVYTVGMTESAIDEHLQSHTHGVLGLADNDDAYAVPLNHHYDGSRLLLRVSEHEDGVPGKLEFLETTAVATYVCYTATEEESWSILIRGPLRNSIEDPDEETLNEWYPPFRVFDETVNNVEFSLWELQMDTVIGRKTISE